jgi:hypothetical protein
MLVVVAILSGMALGAGTAYAAAAASTPPTALAVGAHGKAVGGRALIQNDAGQALELSGPNLVMVLGGGLVAVSLVARRKSS